MAQACNQIVIYFALFTHMTVSSYQWCFSKHLCQVTNCMHADTTLHNFADFPEWAEVMTTWGDKMLAAVHTVAQMSAVGFGLPAGAFTERMAHGPHLLAPTGDSSS